MSFQARSCDRLISPVRERNWKPTVFAIPRRNFDREFCHMRFAANRLASHLESCNRANWSTIRAKFKSRPRTIRHASFQRGSRPRLPPPPGWKTSGMDEKLETIEVWLVETRVTRLLYLFVFIFFIFLFSFPPPSSRNLIRISVCLKENRILWFTGIVSLFLTSIRRAYFCYYYFSIFQAIWFGC